MTQTLAHQETYTEPELELIINRAQEIELQDRLTPSYTPDDICDAAREMGVSEESVTRALEEHRLRRLIGPPQYVFALKFDNRYYIAEQICTHGSRAEIRYMDGTTTSIDRDLTFPAALSPGHRVQVKSKNGWWFPATVTQFNPGRDCATIRFKTGNETNYSFDNLRLTTKQIRENIDIRRTLSSRKSNINAIVIVMSVLTLYMFMLIKLTM